MELYKFWDMFRKELRIKLIWYLFVPLTHVLDIQITNFLIYFQENISCVANLMRTHTIVVLMKKKISFS